MCGFDSSYLYSIWLSEVFLNKNKSKFLKISRYFAYLIVTALEYMHENHSILTTDLLFEIN